MNARNECHNTLHIAEERNIGRKRPNTTSREDHLYMASFQNVTCCFWNSNVKSTIKNLTDLSGIANLNENSGIHLSSNKGETIVTKNESGTNVAKVLTAKNLKSELWDTLNDLRDRKIMPGNADAIAGQAREILRTVKTQLMVSAQTNRSVPMEVVEFSESTTKQ